MSTSTKALLALFGVACLAIIGWLRGAPVIDEPAAQAQVADIRGRRAPPIEPLPLVRAPAAPELAMQRDPFAAKKGTDPINNGDGPH